MARKCFISFKKEDEDYKTQIQNNPKIDYLDYSLDDAIDSNDEEYVVRKLRENYISKVTVLIHLIGTRSAENLGFNEQKYIKRELQAALYDGENNTKSGILGIVLPEMYDKIYGGSSVCGKCGATHNQVYINDSTTIKEFSYNYYIPNNKCFWAEEDRYCVLVKWDDFLKDPEKYIEDAFNKRTSDISGKTKVYPS